jgi:hypothetical protein
MNRNPSEGGVPMSAVAVAAATRVAAGYGLPTEDPVVLQATNNTVLWLRPNEVVAKVGTSLDGAENLVREHTVAVALAAQNAPIAPPLAGTEPTRDPDTGLIVTLWTRLQHDPELEVPPTDIAMALRRLHDDLVRTTGAQPSFEVAVRRARAMLDDDQLMVAPSLEDRSTLRVAIDRTLAGDRRPRLRRAAPPRRTSPREPAGDTDGPSMGRSGGCVRRAAGVGPGIPSRRGGFGVPRGRSGVAGSPSHPHQRMCRHVVLAAPGGRRDAPARRAPPRACST